MPTRYEIIDARTGKVVATARTRDQAYEKADKRDMAYGGVRYTVRPIWP